MIKDVNILPLTYRKLNTALELRFTAAEDPHFVDVNMVRLKTGMVTRSHYILLSDLPVWLNMFEDDKWERYNKKDDQ
jgi:hypothetical protein